MYRIVETEKQTRWFLLVVACDFDRAQFKEMLVCNIPVCIISSATSVGPKSVQLFRKLPTTKQLADRQTNFF